MTEQQICPQCGSEFSRYVPDIFITLFGCGAGVYDDGHKSHSYRCYQRQLAQQAAEIERLRKVLSQVYVHSGDGANGGCKHCNWSSDTAFNALKEVT
jgi:hypothetical protein